MNSRQEAVLKVKILGAIFYQLYELSWLVAWTPKLPLSYALTPP